MDSHICIPYTFNRRKHFDNALHREVYRNLNETRKIISQTHSTPMGHYQILLILQVLELKLFSTIDNTDVENTA